MLQQNSVVAIVLFCATRSYQLYSTHAHTHHLFFVYVSKRTTCLWWMFNGCIVIPSFCYTVYNAYDYIMIESDPTQLSETMLGILAMKENTA